VASQVKGTENTTLKALRGRIWAPPVLPIRVLDNVVSSQWDPGQSPSRKQKILVYIMAMAVSECLIITFCTVSGYTVRVVRVNTKSEGV